MNTKSDSVETAADTQSVLITRTFDAPRELVFKAWTEPEQLMRWYAPKGCTILFTQLEPRAGGEFHSCVNNPNYGDCWCRGVYKEVVFPERLVFTMAVSDEKGNLISPIEAGMDPEWPAETTVTITLKDAGDKTILTLHQTVSEKIAKRTGAHPSWLEMLDQLADELGKLSVS